MNSALALSPSSPAESTRSNGLGDTPPWRTLSQHSISGQTNSPTNPVSTSPHTYDPAKKTPSPEAKVWIAVAYDQPGRTPLRRTYAAKHVDRLREAAKNQIVILAADILEDDQGHSTSSSNNSSAAVSPKSKQLPAQQLEAEVRAIGTFLVLRCDAYEDAMKFCKADVYSAGLVRHLPRLQTYAC